MLKKILKWTGFALTGLVLLMLIAYAVVHFQMESRIHKVYSVKLQSLSIPTDSTTYALGEHVADIRGCNGCHGSDYGGGMGFITEDTPLGVLYASNITSGKGGVEYKDQDWIRALRHGLGNDNKPLWFMPSHEVYRISNREMAALIAYLKQQAPVDRTVPSKSIKPLGRILSFLGQFPLLPAEQIDHTYQYKDDVKLTVDAKYGEYLAVSCMGCHGPKLKGGPAHGPAEPAIPDISSSGNLGKWTADGFVNLFHTNRTPEGRELSKYMPVKDFKYSDDELTAIYLYLRSVK
jgi:mono/diheme cytochrome c family protein